jgi:hypothetical protein
MHYWNLIGSLCGRRDAAGFSSWNWNHVTCKSCLKMRKAYSKYPYKIYSRMDEGRAKTLAQTLKITRHAIREGSWSVIINYWPTETPKKKRAKK